MSLRILTPVAVLLLAGACGREKDGEKTPVSPSLPPAAKTQSATPPVAAAQPGTVLTADSIKLEEIAPFVSMGAAHGDRGKGEHGTFGRFPGGATSPPHTHLGAYRAVIITGEMTNPFGTEKTPTRMGPGSHWFVPAGEQHVTACVSKERCLFFALRLRGTVYFQADVAAPWDMALRRAEVANFHFVVAGSCWVSSDELSTPMRLEAGDLVVVPHLASHRVTHQPEAAALPALELIESTRREEHGRQTYGGNGELGNATTLGYESERPLPRPTSAPSAPAPALLVARQPRRVRARLTPARDRRGESDVALPLEAV